MDPASIPSLSDAPELYFYFRTLREEERMKVQKSVIVPLGYGKYVRADMVVLLLPIEEGRGPGRRTWVHVENVEHPIVASRSDSAILRDMTQSPEEAARSTMQEQVLIDVLDTIQEFDPMLKSIIHKQGNWDLDRLEERIREVLAEG